LTTKIDPGTEKTPFPGKVKRPKRIYASFFGRKYDLPVKKQQVTDKFSDFKETTEIDNTLFVDFIFAYS
jgi:hypothetical protein